jgi:hypothetical protein
MRTDPTVSGTADIAVETQDPKAPIAGTTLLFEPCVDCGADTTEFLPMLFAVAVDVVDREESWITLGAAFASPAVGCENLCANGDPVSLEPRPVKRALDGLVALAATPMDVAVFPFEDDWILVRPVLLADVGIEL